MALTGLRNWAITWQIKFEVMHAGKTSLKFTYEMMVSEQLIITYGGDLWTIRPFHKNVSSVLS